MLETAGIEYRPECATGDPKATWGPLPIFSGPFNTAGKYKSAICILMRHRFNDKLLHYNKTYYVYKHVNL